MHRVRSGQSTAAACPPGPLVTRCRRAHVKLGRDAQQLAVLGLLGLGPLLPPRAPPPPGAPDTGVLITSGAPLCNVAFQTPGPLGPYPDLSPRSLSSPALSCPEALSQTPSSPVATVPKAQEPVPSLQPRGLAPLGTSVLSVTPARGPARPTQEAGEPT